LWAGQHLAFPNIGAVESFNTKDFPDDTAKAKVAYQDFLTLWKDADPDIPVLLAAKAGYAKVK
jgi:hypothetical protein